MKKIKRMPQFVCRLKSAAYVIAAVVLAGSMFMETGVTAQAVKLDDVFDTQAYADRYPDLFAAFGSNAAALLKHYKEHGIDEKREVEGILDVVRYREANPDLEVAFGDNWDAYVNHYFEFGAKEGRDSFTSFDGLAYAERYPDLKEAYGDDLLALYRHYQAFGKDEGRYAETYDIVEDTDEDDEENADGIYADDDDEEVLDGTYLEYFEDGSLRSETVYTNGSVVSKTVYNSDGQKSSEYVYTYDGNGNLSRSESWVYYVLPPYWSVTEYVNGIPTKTTRTYYWNKVMGAAGMEGMVYGVEVYEYDSNGKRTKTTFTRYDQNGNVSTTTTTTH